MKIFFSFALVSLVTWSSVSFAEVTPPPGQVAEEVVYKVTYTLKDYYSGKTMSSSDIRVGVQSLTTGAYFDEGQISGTESGFLLPAGEYRIWGDGYFCGVSEQSFTVTADTTLNLTGWCE